MKNQKLFLCSSFFLLSLLMWLGIAGCQKDKMNTVPSGDKIEILRTSPSGAQLVLNNSKDESSSVITERDNNSSGQKRPVVPFSGGSCRLIFRIYGFDPNLIHGGFEPPCSNSYIYIRGYSAPNGQGTLLFSQDIPITGVWQVCLVPQTAYIMFSIGSGWHGTEDCRFKFTTGEYGWNRSIFEWVNIPYGEWLPVVMGRFAPKDPSVNGNFNLYEEYLCAPWCTWSVPITFTTTDPYPIPWTSTRMNCFYGAAQSSVYTQDPRVIKDHFVYEEVEQTLYYYPIINQPEHTYTSKATNLNNPNANVDFISYYVLGDNGQGSGPFGWGNSWDIVTASKCNIQ